MDGKELLAAINAGLNATSAMLLISAVIAVRRARYRLHAGLMIAAVTVSAAFLVCYITSYYRYGDRSSGLDPGPLRTFYLILLASHVLMAVVVLPMVLTALWFASTRRWSRHRAIARPTYRVWVYVSVTGVLVYWMLYHLFPSIRAAA
jgi:uncharacterized membrane protein YozB (DUF420 family)